MFFRIPFEDNGCVPLCSLTFFLSSSSAFFSSVVSLGSSASSSGSSSLLDSASLSGAPNALTGLLLLKASPALPNDVSLAPPRELPNPLPVEPEPKGLATAPVWPKGEEPFDNEPPPPNTDSVVDPAVLKGEVEAVPLENEERGLLPPVAENGDEVVAKAESPELLKAVAVVCVVCFLSPSAGSLDSSLPSFLLVWIGNVSSYQSYKAVNKKLLPTMTLFRDS